MPKKRIDWPSLVKSSTELVTKEQNASYNFIRERMKIGVGTAHVVLRRLQKAGVVRRGKKRAWTVLVNKDGSPKDPASLPPRRRFRKWQHKNAAASHGNVTRKSAKSKKNVQFSLKKKLRFLKLLEAHAGDLHQPLIAAIAEDLHGLESSRQLLKALGR